MIVILGRSRWCGRGGAIIELACSKRASHCSIEQSVYLFNAAVSLAAEENRVTVTQIRSVAPSKCKERQDKPSYLHRLSNSFIGHLSLLKQLLALMLSTLTHPYYYCYREWSTNKSPAIISLLCRTWLLSKKPQNGTTLVARISLLSALKG